MRHGGKTYIYRQPNPKEIRLDKWARVWVRQGLEIHQKIGFLEH